MVRGKRGYPRSHDWGASAAQPDLEEKKEHHLMKAQDHGNNLIQLTYYGCVNVYLVREDDGFTVIDTALENCAPSIVQVARQFGQPIVRLLPTHAHTDHIGGLDALYELLREAQFIMRARDARFLSGDMRLDVD